MRDMSDYLTVIVFVIAGLVTVLVLMNSLAQDIGRNPLQPLVSVPKPKPATLQPRQI